MKTISKILIFTAILILVLTNCNNHKNKSVTNTNIDNKSQAYKPTKAQVREKFLSEDCNNISSGRHLNLYNTFKDSGIVVILGDLNNDNLIDAVLGYSFEPNENDNVGGGNAVGDISGLIVYLNDGNGLKRLLINENIEYTRLINIKNNTINAMVLDYAPDDARCCPSIEKHIKIGLKTNRLMVLK